MPLVVTILAFLSIRSEHAGVAGVACEAFGTPHTHQIRQIDMGVGHYGHAQEQRAAHAQHEEP